jgi:predicted Holliday junction resolvase-like endonuclease
VTDGPRFEIPQIGGCVVALIDDLLSTPHLRIRCPSCSGEFAARRAKLFDAATPLPNHAKKFIEDREHAVTESWTDLKRRKQHARQRPQTAARTVRIGKVVEKIAATLPEFPAQPADCRSLFEPIDYIVFSGLSTHGEIDSVQFVELKSGRARLSEDQKSIKTAVDSGRVSLLVTEFE